jgi:formate hydrogenlyase transcriptional activator
MAVTVAASSSTVSTSIDSDALAARYDALIEVASAIASYDELTDLLHSLRDHLRPVVSSEFLAVSLYEAENDAVRLSFLDSDLDPARAVVGDPLPLDGSYPGVVVRTRQPVYVPRLQVDGPAPSAKLIAYGIASYCAVPLLTARQMHGSLAFGSSEPDAYARGEIELMARVGRLVAVAVENALQLQAIRKQEAASARERDELGLLLEVTNATVSHLDTRALFRAVAPALRRCCSADVASLTLYDEEAGVLRKHACDFTEEVDVDPPIPVVVPIDGTPTGLVFRTGQGRIFTEAELESLPGAARIRERGMHSYCSVPLITAQGVLGTLNLAARAREAFAPAQLELLTRAASQIAIAVSNASAYSRIEALNARLAQQKLYLEDEIRSVGLFEEIIGRGGALRRVLREIETVAPTDSTVLITGETGTGKELVARAIHQLSARRDHPFVKLNCAAIPTGLLESELFGHEKGAFTGAIAQRIGRFELASQGTVFLDEIGEIPLELQPKLLRVLQEREFERLGSARTLRTDARLIAATNRELATLVQEHQFRQDLFYRLNVFPIHVPPLRDRTEDIPILVRHFAQQFSRRMKKTIDTIPSETMETLERYDWPGNIRELQNLIERAVILSPGSTLQAPLSELRARAVVHEAAASDPAERAPLASRGNGMPSRPHAPGAVTLEEAERRHITSALESTNWIVGGEHGAAAQLGMKRSTLQFRMRKLGIARPR